MLFSPETVYSCIVTYSIHCIQHTYNINMHFEKCATDFLQYIPMCNIEYSFTDLKNKIENNSVWEDVFYQSEWVKLTQVE